MSRLMTYERDHTLSRKAADDALRMLTDVAQRYGESAEPNRITILLDMAADQSPELDAAYAELCGEYGDHPKRIAGIRVTDRTELRAFEWRVPPAGIADALARCAALRERSDLLAERVAVKFFWQFRLRDPVTRELLPGQDALPRLERHLDLSTMLLTLGRTRLLALWLMFPFDDVDAEFRAYVAALERSLPVQFSAKGWRRWQQTRAGSWKASRIDVPGSG